MGGGEDEEEEEYWDAGGPNQSQRERAKRT